jgi:hypothetical protein
LISSHTRKAASAPGRRSVGLRGPSLLELPPSALHGNLLVAEATAKDVGRLSLGAALELTLLIAGKDRDRSDERRLAPGPAWPLHSGQDSHVIANRRDVEVRIRGPCFDVEPHLYLTGLVVPVRVDFAHFESEPHARWRLAAIAEDREPGGGARLDELRMDEGRANEKPNLRVVSGELELNPPRTQKSRLALPGP